jgi:serine/threonine-protein kinase
LREGYVANKVEHAGAVAVLDDDVSEDGAPFLVMELLRGRTLRARLEEEGPLPVAEALRLAEEALDVLAAAHDHGIVHRDIKPDNLFETEEGSVKVLDFGIARLREQALAPTQTQSGTTVGTIGYMAPEQARGRVNEVDARSDVWAMGATLFALVSGRPVHEADTMNEALLLAMTQPVAPVATLLPALGVDVAVILDKALHFDKSGRFADGRDMLRAVRGARACLGSSASILAPAVEPSNRTAEVESASRSIAPKVAGAVLLALALTAAAFAGHGWRAGGAATIPTVEAQPAALATTPSPPAAEVAPAGSAAQTAQPPSGAPSPRSPSSAPLGIASASTPPEVGSHVPSSRPRTVLKAQPSAAPPADPSPPAVPPSATPTSERDPLGPRR